MPSGRIPTFRPRHLTHANRAGRKAYERQGWRAEDRMFYQSRPWRECRALKLATDPLCEECEAKGLTTPAAQVHHIRDRKAYPSLAYDLDNLKSVCLPCHNAERKTPSHGNPESQDAVGSH